MTRTKIFAAAAAVTMLAATTAMAQDISPRGSVYNNGYNYNRGYDANAAYGDNWDNDGPSYRGGYARYGNDWDRGDGWNGKSSTGIPTRSDRGASNGYSGGDTGYRGGYASRNGFVCQPGSVFINENGIRTLCQ